MPLKQGSIVLVDFSYSNLKEANFRAALVISNSEYNENSIDVVVLRVTSRGRDSVWESEILNDDLDEGIIDIEPSYVKVDSINQKTPDVAKAFSGLRNEVYKEGALDVRTKELISVAASVLMRCESCTEIHSERARKHGATSEQIAEAVTCAILVAAGSQLGWTKMYDRILGQKE